eukprot:TRINITY_DN11664_c0_g1_i2.p2 TRINITY_DN11664_c0_g1~~TRINITY_DN11664_c0_g1_i2.p2  ORF type:complete len:231 (+),score=36.62 TRINITY_DN11664_c0_g1_i2:73-693(+)
MTWGRLCVLAALVAATAVAAGHPRFDPYAKLGIPRDADQRDIRKAYRKRSMEAHPDKGGSKEEFIAVTEAYQLLSDPDKRAFFDRTNTVPDGHRKPTFEDAEEFLKNVEELIQSNEKIDELLSQFGNANPADQGWMEWGLKKMARSSIKWLGAKFVDGVRDGTIDVQVNGQPLGRTKARPQREARKTLHERANPQGQSQGDEGTDL